MPRHLPRCALAVLVMAALSGAASATAAAHSEGDGQNQQPRGADGYTARVLLAGTQLTHPVNGRAEQLSKPDDIVSLGRHLFVAFQNGVGSAGKPSSTGNAASTLVEMTRGGDVVGQWDLTGKIDGLAADPIHGMVAATVNEDGNSSLYIVRPSETGETASFAMTRYQYVQNPLPHGGGTDAITFSHGLMLITASAPTKAAGPAVYVATLHSPQDAGGTGTATLTALFADDAAASPANPGAPQRLQLTDPDSSTSVPTSSPRFGGAFMVDSQADRQQVYVTDPATHSQALAVLALSQSVNDTAFAPSDGSALYVTDAGADTVDVVRGAFRAGDAVVAATPCSAGDAPSPCPAPGYPANFLGTLDLTTGTVAPVDVAGVALHPQGMAFLSNPDGESGHGELHPRAGGGVG